MSLSEAAMIQVAARLADAAVAGDVFALWGDLGAGKSTLARAFIRHYAQVRGVAIDEVPSPTFTLVQTYDVAGDVTGDSAGGSVAQTIWHFDLYRIGQPDELWEIGLEEALGGGICLIEWPEKAGGLLPDRRMDIHLNYGDDTGRRNLRLVDRSESGDRFTGIVQDLPAS